MLDAALATLEGVSLVSQEKSSNKGNCRADEKNYFLVSEVSGVKKFENT